MRDYCITLVFHLVLVTISRFVSVSDLYVPTDDGLESRVRYFYVVQC